MRGEKGQQCADCGTRNTEPRYMFEGEIYCVYCLLTALAMHGIIVGLNWDDELHVTKVTL